MANERVNILCLKWGGVYGPEYVNRLYAGVKAHLSRPFRFVCVTDRPAGLVAGVETVAFDPLPPGVRLMNEYARWPNVYFKLAVFRKGFAQLEGPTLFLDIDQIITGSLDDFFEYCPGEFCIIRNWVEWRKQIFRQVPLCGNSSCFRFEAGEKSAYIYRQFLADGAHAMDSSRFTTEQAYLTHAVGLERIHFWPANYVRSFKRACTWPWPLNHLLAPRRVADARILCFHGNPNPQQAIVGYRGRHLNTWTKPCAWVKTLWEEPS